MHDEAISLQALEEFHTSGVYAKRPVSFVRGQGALLFDPDGAAYIDCVGGQGTANLGHGHPAISAAIAQQAQELIALPETFFNPKRAMLSARLSELSGMRRVFFCNSGTEAVEAAIKFARLSTGRTEIVAAMRGFHGRTFGALSATWNAKYRDPFLPLVPGFKHIPYNNLEKLAVEVNENTAAVILEVVQGEGGVHLGTNDFLLGAQQVCKNHGALLIIDEVQTGFGRTGKMFAFQHHPGLAPDLLCVAKSIAGGLPMGAVMIGERVTELPTGAHGSTFGGNPLACAAGLAALDVYEHQRLPERAAVLGEKFRAQLTAAHLPGVREVRGLGLLVGIEMKNKVAPYIQALLEKRVLVLSAGLTVIRLLPPLVIQAEQLEQVAQALTEVIQEEAKPRTASNEHDPS